MKSIVVENQEQPLAIQAADRRIARLERLADTLDSSFRIPGTQIRFGWDSVLGLLPGVGDAAALAPALWLLVEGRRMGARRRTLVRMAVNTAVDAAVGTVPVIGDIFDIGFKSNRRNITLLKRELGVVDEVGR